MTQAGAQHIEPFAALPNLREIIRVEISADDFKADPGTPTYLMAA